MSKTYDPKIWGPAGWEFLFTIAIAYNNQHFNNYKTVFENLGNILPCLTCSQNYNTYLTSHPLRPEMDLLEWVINLHNETARIKLNRDTVLRRMEQKYNKQFAHTAIQPTLSRKMKLLKPSFMPSGTVNTIRPPTSFPQKHVPIRKKGCACAGKR